MTLSHTLQRVSTGNSGVLNRKHMVEWRGRCFKVKLNMTVINITKYESEFKPEVVPFQIIIAQKLLISLGVHMKAHHQNKGNMFSGQGYKALTSFL